MNTGAWLQEEDLTVDAWWVFFYVFNRCFQDVFFQTGVPLCGGTWNHSEKRTPVTEVSARTIRVLSRRPSFQSVFVDVPLWVSAVRRPAETEVRRQIHVQW